MCVLPVVWLCLISGLLSREVFSLHRHQKPSHTNTQPEISVALDNQISQDNTPITWVGAPNKDPPAKLSHGLHDRNYEFQEARGWPYRSQRHRRHANGGIGKSHSHLMRVGCVLGTCQVQNLSHRLYQLIGQSGRDDSSPIDPRSPHSYG